MRRTLHRNLTRVGVLGAMAVTFSFAGMAGAAQRDVHTRQPAAARPADDTRAALKQFEDRLAAYLKLREGLVKKLKPLSSTLSSSELTARQDALAAALREVRRGAKPGDLIPPAVAKQIRDTIADDFAHRRQSDVRAAFEEVAVGPPPAVNSTFPAKAALPTVQPLLLNRLPRLPDNLQYRFYDRHLVILDGDAQIIVDYLLNVLPPLARGDPGH